MDPNLNVDIGTPSEGQNHQVIDFNGEFDKAGYTDVKEELNKAIEDFSLKYLVFNFAKLNFINSEGIGYLMEVHTHLVQRDRKLVIVGLNAHVKDVFNTIGMSEIIDSHDELDGFLNSL
jgi:anti-anti-sigma factor